MPVRILARRIQLVVMVRVFDCAYAKPHFPHSLDKFNDKRRLAVILTSDNVNSLHFNLPSPPFSIVFSMAFVSQSSSEVRAY